MHADTVIFAFNTEETPSISTTKDDFLDEKAVLLRRLQRAEQRLVEQDLRIKELEKLAETDPMTGLLNRRGFERFFLQEQARTQRKASVGSTLLLFDLDRFKAINDTYGHQAGDACLRKVAEYLQGRLRSGDAAARLGGDEFAVLLSNTAANAPICDIREALGNMTVTWQGKTLAFGVSIGFRHVPGGCSYENAYLAADCNLYSDKRQRHNRA